MILSRVVLPGIFPTGSISLRRSASGSSAETVAMTYDGSSIVSMLASVGDGDASLACTYDLLKPEQTKRCE